MDKTEQVERWIRAVEGLFLIVTVIQREGRDLSDSDILSAVTTREDRAKLAVWLQDIDAWAQTDFRRVTLPSLLLGQNLLEFTKAELLKAATDAEVLADVERLLGLGDPCSPESSGEKPS